MLDFHARDQSLAVGNIRESVEHFGIRSKALNTIRDDDRATAVLCGFLHERVNACFGDLTLFRPIFAQRLHLHAAEWQRLADGLCLRVNLR